MAESRKFRRYNFRAHDRALHEKNSSMKSAPWEQYVIPGMKKYELGCDVDKEKIFDFPFLADEDSVSYLQQHGKIMFIVRGPPGTGKKTLSEMLLKYYPSAAYCCADRYFAETFTSDRNRETLKESHDYCEKLVTDACLNSKSPIIIQNTHVRKWEMQKYLDLAAKHSYTVIMAITLFKFDVSVQALAKTNSDGLDFNYFKRRMRSWDHVLPYITGWFLCPEDASYILNSLKRSLKILLNDGRFCRIFDIYDDDALFHQYKARRLLCCVASYAKSKADMEKYYFSAPVQNYCGKSCVITILGYIVSESIVNAIVHIEDDLKCLLYKDSAPMNKHYNVAEELNTLELDDNIIEFGATIPLSQEFSANGKTTTFENWKCDEVISATNSTLICVAQKDKETKKEFHNSLSSVQDNEGEDDTGYHLT
ncbi:NEDD4-binding protein 2-like 1, partial [Stegodyphus mimosarum]